MPQSQETADKSTVIYAPPPSKRFYYSAEEKAKIEEEVAKCPGIDLLT
jgi:hypothetical protein